MNTAKPHLTAALLAIACFVPLACGESEAESEADARAHVDDLLDELVLELNHQEYIYCDCWQEYDYTSRSECESFFIGPSQSRCMKDAFAEDLEASRIYLECYVPLEREYTACIDSRLECHDDASTDPCGQDYSVGSDECVDLPTAVERNLDGCFE